MLQAAYNYEFNPEIRMCLLMMLTHYKLCVRSQIPFDNEADPMALVQDALELWNPIRTGPLEWDLVGNTDDLHSPGVAGYFAVGDRHHVI